jgi:hypothetical protein
MAFFANQVIEATIKGKALGQDILNIIHYRVVDPATFPPGGVSIAGYTDDLVLAWRAACLPGVSNLYTVTSYNIRALVSTSTNPGPPEFTQIDVGDQDVIAGVPGTDVGALAADPAPTFNAVGVRKFADRAGRNFRGGLRIGPITELQTDGNSLVAAEVTAYTDRWTIFKDTNLNSEGGNEVQPCVFSRTLTLKEPVPFTALRDHTAQWVAALINTFITSQVSRKQSLTSTT